jgi:MFS family permease
MAESGSGPPEAAPRGASRSFVLLCAAVFLEACGIGVLFPLLARIQSVHHLPTYALGLMSGANFLAALVVQLGVGRFLDGARARRLLLAGILLGSASLVWFAHSDRLWELVASRAVEGLGYGIIGPASLREAAGGATGPRRGSRLGILSSAMMAGIVIGPLIGSLLAAVGGIALPFDVVAGLLAGVFVACLFDPPAVPAVDVAPPAAAPDAPWRPVLAILLLGVATQLPNGLYDALWSRLMTDRGASGLFIGLSLSLFGVPFIALAPFGGRIAERRGPLLATAVTLVIADGFMASYGFVPSPVAITILGVAEACFQAVAVPGAYAAVARAFTDQRAATGQSWFSGAGTAAAGSAALLGASAYGAFGSGPVFAGGAVISVVFVLSGLTIGRSGIERSGAGRSGARAATEAGSECATEPRLSPSHPSGSMPA